MKNKVILGLTIATLGITQATSAMMPKETARYFNGPTVSGVTETSATFSLKPEVLTDINDYDKSQIYFEYIQTNLACPAIYPTPASCLPKKTELGKTTVSVNDLKPNTPYTVKYKKDNSIRCITTPCPGNEFESLSVEFKTTGSTSASTTPPVITIPSLLNANLRVGQIHAEVKALQNFLIQRGYLSSNATGYFGPMTMRAVQTFQKMNNIIATGTVGPLTRSTINKAMTPAKGEMFEGKVEAFSTSCFADGICSVTVGGKVVVTTRGWARDPVGTLKGVESIGDVEKMIGHNAKVYAAKTEDGNYTLYGNTDFYVEIQ